MIRSETCWVAYASSNPGSWNGFRLVGQRPQAARVLLDQHNLATLLSEACRRGDAGVPGSDARRLQRVVLHDPMIVDGDRLGVAE